MLPRSSAYESILSFNTLLNAFASSADRTLGSIPKELYTASLYAVFACACSACQDSKLVLRSSFIPTDKKCALASSSDKLLGSWLISLY